MPAFNPLSKSKQDLQAAKGNVETHRKNIGDIAKGIQENLGGSGVSVDPSGITGDPTLFDTGGVQIRAAEPSGTIGSGGYDPTSGKTQLKSISDQTSSTIGLLMGLGDSKPVDVDIDQKIIEAKAAQKYVGEVDTDPSFIPGETVEPVTGSQGVGVVDGSATHGVPEVKTQDATSVVEHSAEQSDVEGAGQGSSGDQSEVLWKPGDPTEQVEPAELNDASPTIPVGAGASGPTTPPNPKGWNPIYRDPFNQEWQPFQQVVNRVREETPGRVMCFTGHRPKYFPWKSNETAPDFLQFREHFKKSIINAYNQNFRVFIGGMQKGVDIWAAEIVIQLRDSGKYPGIKFVGAVPTENVPGSWSSQDIKRYKQVLKESDAFGLVSPGKYSSGMYDRRNKAMLENSELVMAVYIDGKRGGTFNMINDTRRSGKTLILINPVTLETKIENRKVPVAPAPTVAEPVAPASTVTEPVAPVPAMSIEDIIAATDGTAKKDAEKESDTGEEATADAGSLPEVNEDEVIEGEIIEGVPYFGDELDETADLNGAGQGADSAIESMNEYRRKELTRSLGIPEDSISDEVATQIDKELSVATFTILRADFSLYDSFEEFLDYVRSELRRQAPNKLSFMDTTKDEDNALKISIRSIRDLAKEEYDSYAKSQATDPDDIVLPSETVFVGMDDVAFSDALENMATVAIETIAQLNPRDYETQGSYLAAVFSAAESAGMKVPDHSELSPEQVNELSNHHEDIVQVVSDRYKSEMADTPVAPASAADLSSIIAATGGGADGADTGAEEAARGVGRDIEKLGLDSPTGNAAAPTVVDGVVVQEVNENSSERERTVEAPGRDKARKEVERDAKRVVELGRSQDIKAYIESKARYVPGLSSWLAKVDQIVNVLGDPSIPYAALDMDEIMEQLNAFEMIVQEDAFKSLIKEGEEIEAEADAEPVPRGMYKVDGHRKNYRHDYANKKIALDGDYEKEVKIPIIKDGKPSYTTKKVKVHSDRVNTAIYRFLRELGYTDPGEYPALMIQVHRAVRLYRGLSPDMNGKWFKEKTLNPVITDTEFVVALEEMLSNIEKSPNGFPFVYTGTNAWIRGTRAFPLVMTLPLAQFFTARSAKANRDGLAPEDYVAESVRQFREVTLPAMKRLGNIDQMLVLINCVDALAEVSPAIRNEASDGTPGWTPRPPERFKTLGQMLMPGDPFALTANNNESLASAAVETDLQVLNATTRTEGRQRRLDERTDMYRSIQSKFAWMTKIAIINALVGKAYGWLMGTGVIERTDGLVRVNIVSRILSTQAKKRAEAQGVEAPIPSGSFLNKIGQSDGVARVMDAARIAGSTGGQDALIAAANDPQMVFGRNAYLETMKTSTGDSVVKGLRAKVEGLSHLAVTVSTGDFFGNAEMARLWLRYFCLYLADSAAAGERSFTPSQLEEMYNNNPDDFFKQAMLMKEGRAALRMATSSSLAGFNMFTDQISKWIDTPAKQFVFGAASTFFLKYQTNIMLRFMPFSTYFSYAVKRGIINPMMMSAAERSGDQQLIDSAAADVAISDALIIGGHHKPGGNIAFDDGAKLSLLVDCVNSGRDIGVFLILMTVISSLGVEPPDDEDKYYNFREWRIGGEIVQESWFWGDLLGFIMPAIIGIHAAGDADKKGKNGSDVGWKVFQYGAWDVVQQNPWVQMTSLLDIVAQIQEGHEQESDRADGENLTQSDSIILTMMSFAIRRGYTIFEPSIVREVYNETGMFGGVQDLDVSSTQIFTPTTTDDDTETTQTTYFDSRIRRVIKNSPGFGVLANAISGYYFDSPETQKTGYLRGERPLIRNADPLSKMWVDKFTPRTADGTPLDYDPENPELYAGIVREVRGLISNDEYPAQVLAASGVAIPYGARLATDDSLFQESAAIWKEYKDRVVSGEFIVEGRFDRELVLEAKAAQQEAYEETVEKTNRISNLRKKLWSREIPYKSIKMNRISTPFRELVVFKEGHPRAGEVAPPWYSTFNRSDVEVRLYPVGSHKSGWLPWTKVDDVGDLSYDARAQAPWYDPELTNPELVENSARGYIVPDGLATDQDLLDALTGDGATGLSPTKTGRWNMAEYLFPLRGYVREQEEYFEPELPEWDFSDVKPTEDDYAKAASGGKSGGGYGGGGGGGSWSPRIYSNSANSINADRPASMYGKNANYTRFDYLRPSVETKGSREAYRREDF